MIFIGGGVIAFILFALYDWGQVRGVKGVYKSFFALGCVLLLVCTAGLIWQKSTSFHLLWPFRLICAALAAVNLVLLIYTLFFALPFEKTYVKQNNFTKVYDQKMYALCRHPGVLWFAFGALFLALALDKRSFLFAALVWSGCNGIYVLLQDRIFFPRLFADYDAYRHTTPFLIPNRSSITRCITSYQRRDS